MKLKIRYVKRGDIYFLQIRKWFSWWYQSYWVDMGYGSVEYFYENKDKKELLKEVLDEKYKTTLKYVDITEYPGLIIYDK
jgi:hypothetical protein